MNTVNVALDTYGQHINQLIAKYVKNYEQLLYNFVFLKMVIYKQTYM